METASDRRGRCEVDELAVVELELSEREALAPRPYIPIIRVTDRCEHSYIVHSSSTL